MQVRRLRRPAVLGVAATALLVGCGQGGDRETVRSVSEGFYRAVAAKQGGRACELLGSDTRSELEKQERKPCDEAVLGLELKGSAAANEEVHLNAARVELAGGDTVFLEEGKEGWRVSAAGCKPVAKDEPYDCEVQA